MASISGNCGWMGLLLRNTETYKLFYKVKNLNLLQTFSFYFRASPNSVKKLVHNAKKLGFLVRNLDISFFINFFSVAMLGWVCYAEKTHGSYILPYIR